MNETKDILLEEVNTIGDKIRAKLSTSARIIFGVVNDESMKGKLKMVVIEGYKMEYSLAVAHLYESFFIFDQNDLKRYR